MPNKRSEYAELVQQRKECRLCEGLMNPSDPQLSEYDSEEIGPWSRLHGDLDAHILIVGQDWGDVAYFQKNAGLDKLNNPTMKRLQELLRSVGLDVSLTAYGQSPAKLFLTNAVLCLKQGGLQGSVRREWFSNCGTKFLRRQIEIVKPRVVIALGENAYRALCEAFNLTRVPLRDAVSELKGISLLPSTVLFPMYHCGNRIINTHRTEPMQWNDWRKVENALQLQADA